MISLCKGYACTSTEPLTHNRRSDVQPPPPPLWTLLSFFHSLHMIRTFFQSLTAYSEECHLTNHILPNVFFQNLRQWKLFKHDFFSLYVHCDQISVAKIRRRRRRRRRVNNKICTVHIVLTNKKSLCQCDWNYYFYMNEQLDLRW